MYEVMAGSWDEILGEEGYMEQVPNVKVSYQTESFSHAVDLYKINAGRPWCCLLKDGEIIRGFNPLD